MKLCMYCFKYNLKHVGQFQANLIHNTGTYDPETNTVGVDMTFKINAKNCRY